MIPSHRLFVWLALFLRCCLCLDRRDNKYPYNSTELEMVDQIGYDGALKVGLVCKGVVQDLGTGVLSGTTLRLGRVETYANGSTFETNPFFFLLKFDQGGSPVDEFWFFSANDPHETLDLRPSSGKVRYSLVEIDGETGYTITGDQTSVSPPNATQAGWIEPDGLGPPGDQECAATQLSYILYVLTACYVEPRFS
jgi:hypothetical protein